MLVTPEIQNEVLNILSTQKIFFVDIESSGLDTSLDILAGIGVGICSGKTYYFPHGHKQGVNLSIEVIKNLIEILNNADLLIGWNFKFDVKFLMRFGFNPWSKGLHLADVPVAVRLGCPDFTGMKFGLKEVTKAFYGSDAVEYVKELSALMRRNKWTKNLRHNYTLPLPADVAVYCEKDVEWTRQIYYRALCGIHHYNQDHIWNMAINQTKTLLRMEIRGVATDQDYCLKAMSRIESRLKWLEEQCYALVGYEFNVDAPLQVGDAFKTLGIEAAKKTKLGTDSWDESALYSIDHPLAGYVKEHRTLVKYLSTYLTPALAAAALHTTYRNWGAVTGRLSSSDPPLQVMPRSPLALTTIELTDIEKKEIQLALLTKANAKIKQGELPIRVIPDCHLSLFAFGNKPFDENDDRMVAIKRLYVARPGYVLYSFDYAQMEVRVFLSYLNNPEILERMKLDSFEPHAETAILAYGVSKEQSDFKFYRQCAKCITFGIMYGLGNERLGVQLGTTAEIAKGYKSRYFAAIPGAKRFIDDTSYSAKINGYLENRFGRRYVIPFGREYIGVNYKVQGTSADILNYKMIELDDMFVNDDNCHMLLQVHDELVFEIKIGFENYYVPLIKQSMEQNTLGIPLRVDPSKCEPSLASKGV